jgi:hypothetical protein
LREHRYWRHIDILGRAGVLGTLAIKFSHQPLIAAYRETLNLGARIAIVGLMATAVVGALMDFLLTRRLRVLAAHPRIPDDQRTQLRSLILSWPLTAEGRAIMAIGSWPRFIPAQDADYEEVRNFESRPETLAER